MRIMTILGVVLVGAFIYFGVWAYNNSRTFVEECRESGGVTIEGGGFLQCVPLNQVPPGVRG